MNAKPNKLRAPPFGSELIRARALGRSCNVFLHVGPRAWERAGKRPSGHRLCLPPGEDFSAYDWSCCRDLDITLVSWRADIGADVELARHLVRSGAKLVVLLLPATTPIKTRYFKPSANLVVR